VEPAHKLLKRILAERGKKWEEAELAKMKEMGMEPKDGPWKKRYKEPELPDYAGMQELPRGWCWATVQQLASPLPRSIQSGPFGSNLLHSEFQEAGRLVIGIDNVQDGYFSMGATHRITKEKFDELKKYAARPEDVLITVMATIGRTCVVPSDIEPAIITKHVYRITPNKLIVEPRYLHLALWGGSAVRQQMNQQTRGQTRPGLNGTIIKGLVIPIPPLEEQREVIGLVDSRLSLIDNLLPSVEKSEIRASRLRQSILKKAFSGELVPQDPNDQPAKDLLARIRIARDKHEIELKRQKKKETQPMKTPGEPLDGKKRDLIEVLKEANRSLRPEELFRLAGYKAEEVEEFYADLKKADDGSRISQIKKKNGEVYLKAAP
jgi:type I restriction enzyme, S subunit